MPQNDFQHTLQVASLAIEAVETYPDLMRLLQNEFEQFGYDVYNTKMGSLGTGSILIERDLFAGIDRFVLVAGCENCGNPHEDMICVQTDDSAFHYVKPERLHHAYNDK
jgi:hypothetical protein